ncbi:hypothetical protein ACA910_001804 [Epithemia clementina (nom. ined.)]
MVRRPRSALCRLFDTELLTLRIENRCFINLHQVAIAQLSCHRKVHSSIGWTMKILKIQSSHVRREILFTSIAFDIVQWQKPAGRFESDSPLPRRSKRTICINRFGPRFKRQTRPGRFAFMALKITNRPGNRTAPTLRLMRVLV